MRCERGVTVLTPRKYTAPSEWGVDRVGGQTVLEGGGYAVNGGGMSRVSETGQPTGQPNQVEMGYGRLLSGGVIRPRGSVTAWNTAFTFLLFRLPRRLERSLCSVGSGR